jgi:hypothetical protein
MANSNHRVLVGLATAVRPCAGEPRKTSSFRSKCGSRRDIKSASAEREARRRDDFNLVREDVLRRVLAMARMIRGEDAVVHRDRADEQALLVVLTQEALASPRTPI